MGNGVVPWTMEFDASGWSGDGAFTQVLVDALKTLPGLRLLKVEDAPASRTDAAFSFISNEVYVAFDDRRASASTFVRLSAILEQMPDVGAPDYADEGMLQYHLGLAREGLQQLAPAGTAIARAEKLGYRPSYERLLTPRLSRRESSAPLTPAEILKELED